MRRKTWWRALACGGAVAAVAALGAGRVRWERQTSRSVERLDALSKRAGEGAGDGTSLLFLPELGGSVPAQVARYFAFALTPGQPLISRARLIQRGSLRGGLGAPWMPFTAVEYFSTRPFGFVWDASARLGTLGPLSALAPARIRDSYLSGRGTSEAKLAGLISLGSQRGTPEATSASFVRYLAEAAWLPTVLLPSERLHWNATGEQTARATLTDGALSVWIDISFGQRGEIERVETERYRDVGGTAILTPWVGHFADYACVQGMMMPMSATVAWAPPEGYAEVWSGRIVAATYDFAK